LQEIAPWSLLKKILIIPCRFFRKLPSGTVISAGRRSTHHQPLLLIEVALRAALRLSSGMRVKCSTAAITMSRGDSPCISASSASFSRRSSGRVKEEGMAPASVMADRLRGELSVAPRSRGMESQVPDSTAAAFSSTSALRPSLNSRSRCRSEESNAARISTARIPAFFAPAAPRAIVATGMPPGI
jgi:hypothetical protein